MPGLWERFNDVPGGSGLNYYLGPAAKPISALAQFLPQMLPGADTVDMRNNSAALLDYQGPMETIGDAGWLGLSTLGMALPGRPGALREPVEQATQGIRAYHGSPHDFDAFSMDKIGTGEGAQAYGHGLYFAESEGVAKSYRDALANDVSSIGDMAVNTSRNPSEAVEAWGRAASHLPRDVQQIVASKLGTRLSAREILDDLTVDAPESIEEVGRILQSSPGHMYEVNINASPDDFLDWDKPLSEQSEKVRGALPEMKPEWTGGQVHESSRLVPGEFMDKKAAQSALNARGIPGIRYLDQGSRTAGDGSRNYVVFDDSLVSILRKYGMAGLLAGSGLALSAQEHQGGEY
jgi:hypothetical protein